MSGAREKSVFQSAPPKPIFVIAGRRAQCARASWRRTEDVNSAGSGGIQIASHIQFYAVWCAGAGITGAGLAITHEQNRHAAVC